MDESLDITPLERAVARLEDVGGDICKTLRTCRFATD